ncbi:MAG TPA: flagellar motor switch protein FliM [Verrucomicrobiae bacterium]|jgi:flagellar motor switch protein FliM|nr:flagellar motor switch protein FliM [Verrucomicrobiae bacterium]
MSDAAPPSEVFVLTAKGGRERRPAGDIRGHDFRQSGFLAPSELRRIRQRHEQFIRSLAARLAIFLRLEFSLQLSKVQIGGYQNFVENLPSPTHITLFKTDPLKGVGLLVIPPRLGLTLVDRLLGGAGQSTEEPRELSEIETALIDQVASLIIGEWCNHWPEMRGLQPSLLGHENNSRYLQTAAPDTAMLILTMNGGVGEQSEPIQIVFPYATVEPLVRLLSPSLPAAETPARASRPKWNTQFNEIRVPVVAEWQGLRMSAGEILRLKAGDLIALDPACAAQVHLRLNQVPRFIGRPGTSGGKWAVQLTAINNNTIS